MVDVKTVNVPTKPAVLAVNMWSDGGEWSGRMKVGGRATMDVQWIEVVYNTTEGRRDRQGKGCRVDGGVLGMPEEM